MEQPNPSNKIKSLEDRLSTLESEFVETLKRLNLAEKRIVVLTTALEETARYTTAHLPDDVIPGCEDMADPGEIPVCDWIEISMHNIKKEGK